MSRIELDCKNYKCLVNNKCDRRCKKFLNKASIRTAQGPRLKNTEIKKKNMIRAPYLTKLANIPKLMEGGHIESACLLTDVINNKYSKGPCIRRTPDFEATQFEVSFKLYCYKQPRTENRGFETPA